MSSRTRTYVEECLCDLQNTMLVKIIREVSAGCSHCCEDHAPGCSYCLGTRWAVMPLEELWGKAKVHIYLTQDNVVELSGIKVTVPPQYALIGSKREDGQKK